MNKFLALIILPAIATIYAAAPTIYIFVASMTKVSQAFGG